MIAWHPNFWQGIGEILTRHGALTALTEGETATADSEALAKIYDFAAEQYLPVLLHSDLGPVWDKEDGAAAKTPLYLSELERAVKNHPHTTFIWAHAGLNRGLYKARLTSTIESMLAKYPNLSIDISGFALNYIVQDKRVDPAWLNLINRFPDRIIFGSDVVGHFGDYSQTLSAYQPLLDALSSEVAEKVFATNMLRLLPQYANR